MWMKELSIDICDVIRNQCTGGITLIQIILQAPLFRDLLGLVPADSDEPFPAVHQPQMVLSNSSLAMVLWPHPSLPWCSSGITRHQPAAFSLFDREKSLMGRYPANGAGGRSSSHCHLKSWTWGIGVEFNIVLVQKPVLVWQSATFGFEIQLGLGQSLLDVGYIESFVAGLSKTGGDSNHNIDSPFCHFGCFLSLTSLMREFSWFYDLFLSFTHSPPIFFSHRLFAALASATTKTYSYTSIMARTGGGTSFKVVWPALPGKWLIRAGCPLKWSDRK